MYKKNNYNELCSFTVIGAGDGNRTHVVSLEGWSSTIELHPQHQRWCPGPESNRHGVWSPRDFKSRASTNFATRARMVGRDGFEPSNQKELSYSQPRLATSLPPQYMVPTIGIEPTTYWLQVSCSTNWAKSANKQMVGANGLEPLTLCL